MITGHEQISPIKFSPGGQRVLSKMILTSVSSCIFWLTLCASSDYHQGWCDSHISVSIIKDGSIITKIPSNDAMRNKIQRRNLTRWYHVYPVSSSARSLLTATNFFFSKIVEGWFKGRQLAHSAASSQIWGCLRKCRIGLIRTVPVGWLTLLSVKLTQWIHIFHDFPLHHRNKSMWIMKVHTWSPKSCVLFLIFHYISTSINVVFSFALLSSYLWPTDMNGEIKVDSCCDSLCFQTFIFFSSDRSSFYHCANTSPSTCF